MERELFEPAHDAVQRRRRLRQLLAGYQISRALLALDELGLVELLEQGARSSDELARATGTHAPSVQRLLRALASVEVVTEQDGLFSLAPLALGLRELGTARLGLESYRAWGELTHTFRTGKPTFDRVYGKPFYEYIGEDPVRGARWDNAMVEISHSCPLRKGSGRIGGMGRTKGAKGKMSSPRRSAKEDQLALVRELFAAWGRQGGKVRASNLSAEERSAQARRAVTARWKSKKKD